MVGIALRLQLCVLDFKITCTVARATSRRLCSEARLIVSAGCIAAMCAIG